MEDKVKLEEIESSDIEETKKDKWDLTPKIEEDGYGGIHFPEVDIIPEVKNVCSGVSKTQGVKAEIHCLSMEIPRWKSKHLVLMTVQKIENRVRELNAEIHKLTDDIVECKGEYGSKLIRKSLGNLIQQREVLLEARNIIDGNPLYHEYINKKEDDKK